MFFSGQQERGYHVQEAVNFIGALARESSALDAVHELALHSLRVVDLLHEAGVLFDTGNTEGLHLGTDSVYEVVIFDSRRRNFTLYF